MRIASSLRAALLATAAGMIIVSVAGGQTLTPTVSLTSGVTLKTFTPVDSLFLNSTLTSFSIALVNTVSGAPTEYRVSRFSDFHDASWLPYVARPTVTIQRSVFPAVTNGQTQITLYFQVRAKNPNGGRPISSINGTTTVQPDFYLSAILKQAIRLKYFG